MFLISNWLL